MTNDLGKSGRMTTNAYLLKPRTGNVVKMWWRLEQEVADIIQILGKRPAVAKVMPAYMEDRGKDVIQRH